MREIRQILGDMDYEILSMKEAGVDIDIAVSYTHLTLPTTREV